MSAGFPVPLGRGEEESCTDKDRKASLARLPAVVAGPLLTPPPILLWTFDYKGHPGPGRGGELSFILLHLAGDPNHSLYGGCQTHLMLLE